MEKKNNFECDKCEKKFFLPNYKISFSGGEKIYKDKYNDLIICPNCKSKEIKGVKGEFEGFGTFGVFSSKTLAEKAIILKSRAKKHAQTSVEKSRREHLHRHYDGQIQKGDY